jgi:hypothetical protein
VFPLPIVLCFGRSGGTLVNQLLGTHPACLVLSEVNPAASFKPIAEQAVEWLQLITTEEASGFALSPYIDQIRTLERLAAKQDKRLLVRDWTSVNFVRCSPYAYPSRRLEQIVYLTGRLPIAPLAVVRRGADVYASWEANFPQFDIGAEAFADAYLDYAAAVRDYPIVRLEELRKHPARELLRIFAAFELAEAPLEHVLGHFHEFDRCTGNNTLAVARGVQPRGILPPPARSRDATVAVGADVAARFAQADKWLGYD